MSMSIRSINIFIAVSYSTNLGLRKANKYHKISQIWSLMSIYLLCLSGIIAKIYMYRISPKYRRDPNIMPVSN